MMREGLSAWIKQRHKGQPIRQTDRPYFDHLVFVAELSGAVMPLGYEIGLCHDLLEETAVTGDQLYEKLSDFGYRNADARHIACCVAELSDVFTRKAFPGMRKKERKKNEARRLAGISADAQTVKYADLIYNINWMVIYDQKHAPDYLRRKRKLISAMTLGNEQLRSGALALIASLI